MFNVYAQRATKPNDMDQLFNEKLHHKNMKAFRWALDCAGLRPCIGAAWGTAVEQRKYLRHCLKDMISIGDEYNAKWLRTGFFSKAGHPHHPLYLPKDSRFDDFDIDKYSNIL